MDAKDVLTEAFGRLPEARAHGGARAHPRSAALAARPRGELDRLAWSGTRRGVQDDHVAEVMGVEQVYASGDWPVRFGLKDQAETGYGHDAAEVAAVAPESAQVLVDYYRAVHDRTVAWLDGLTEADLDRVVDDNWDPPVTLGVRLISGLRRRRPSTPGRPRTCAACSDGLDLGGRGLGERQPDHEPGVTRLGTPGECRHRARSPRSGTRCPGPGRCPRPPPWW